MTLKERLAAAARGVWQRLFEPVDIASIVFFRIAFGVVMIVEVIRFWAQDWIAIQFIKPVILFKYYGFEWVRPLPGDGMYYVFIAIAVLALCIIAGLWYRVAITLFFFFFTYIFLLDQARYLNHFYLICLMSFLMIFVPAHRAFSLDARRNPSIRSRTVPRWALWILRGQLTILYVYGAIAKLDPDWLAGAPMRTMLAPGKSLPWVGHLATDQRVVMLFAIGGLLFDLLIVPLLLWRRTRWFALIWALMFHGANQFLFEIGIFPSFAFFASLIFLPPDWPRRVAAKFRRQQAEEAAAPKARARKIAGPGYSKPVVAVLAAFFVVQILLPFRHLLYPGNANWTEEGQRFAWRMMLREKTGVGRFLVRDRVTGQQQAIYPARFMEKQQLDNMWLDPDMILQLAHFVADQMHKQGWQVVEVRSNVHMSLNGRRQQLLIDPNVDLASQRRSLLPKKWILPLTEPLPSEQGGRASSPATAGHLARQR